MHIVSRLLSCPEESSPSTEASEESSLSTAQQKHRPRAAKAPATEGASNNGGYLIHSSPCLAFLQLILAFSWLMALAFPVLSSSPKLLCMRYDFDKSLKTKCVALIAKIGLTPKMTRPKHPRQGACVAHNSYTVDGVVSFPGIEALPSSASKCNPSLEAAIANACGVTAIHDEGHPTGCVIMKRGNWRLSWMAR